VTAVSAANPNASPKTLHEELEIGGERSQRSRRGFPSTLGAMGDSDLRSMQPDNDPAFAAAQSLGVPFAIHPTFEPYWCLSGRVGGIDNLRQLRLLSSVTASDGVRHQFTTLFDFGVFDRFPDLKVVVLESGGGRIGYWLDRIDAVYGHTFIGTRVPLEHKPSDYFRDRIWISCDPDERTIPALASRFGADRFMWASDFPHADHTPEYLTDLAELAAAFPDADRRTFLGDNARSLFGIPTPRWCRRPPADQTALLLHKGRTRRVRADPLRGGRPGGHHHPRPARGAQRLDRPHGCRGPPRRRASGQLALVVRGRPPGTGGTEEPHAVAVPAQFDQVVGEGAAGTLDLLQPGHRSVRSAGCERGPGR
jgi:predicted TIM-barrel fold metal-dependent hydrolase